MKRLLAVMMIAIVPPASGRERALDELTAASPAGSLPTLPRSGPAADEVPAAMPDAARLAEHLERNGEVAPEGQGVGLHREHANPDGSWEAVEAILVPRKRLTPGAAGLSARYERIEAYRHRRSPAVGGRRRSETVSIDADLSGRVYRVRVISKEGTETDWTTTPEKEISPSSPAAVEAWAAVVTGLMPPAAKPGP